MFAILTLTSCNVFVILMVFFTQNRIKIIFFILKKLFLILTHQKYFYIKKIQNIFKTQK